MIKYAIIVAGGEGTRMEAKKPKQFLEIQGKPILVHTIEKFVHAGVHIIVVLPQNHFAAWERIREKHLPAEEIAVAKGGNTRTASVRAGLDLIETDGLVAVHDAVRPFVTMELIEQCYLSAEDFGCGVAAVELKDSLRKRKGAEDSEGKNRKNYMLVQTPQTFKVSKLKAAYDKINGSYSDDATIFELAGEKVRLVEGDYSNIKITTIEDLK